MLAGAAGVTAAYGWFPLINTIDIAYGQQAPFRFAWVSDNHLYPKDVNTRFVEKTVRAFKEVQAMNPAADFMILGGDLAQLGDAARAGPRRRSPQGGEDPKVFIPGEHDWYLDMGQKWMALFGQPNWTFDHKGVRVRRPRHRDPRTGLLDGEEDDDRRSGWATWRRSTAPSPGPGPASAGDQLEWLNRTLVQLARRTSPS